LPMSASSKPMSGFTRRTAGSWDTCTIRRYPRPAPKLHAPSLFGLAYQLQELSPVAVGVLAQPVARLPDHVVVLERTCVLAAAWKLRKPRYCGGDLDILPDSRRHARIDTDGLFQQP